MLILLLSACTEDAKNDQVQDSSKPELQNNDDQTETSEEVNSSSHQNFPAILKDLEASFSSYELPFSIAPDSLSNLSQIPELNLEQVKYISKYFNPLEKFEGYYIDKSLELYKLKAEGKYNTYTAELDLGQLRDATVHPYGRIDLDTAMLLLWRIEFTSFEACPYYAGAELYVSVVTGDTVNQCYLVGEEWAGGDPPAAGEIMTRMTINKNLKIDRAIYEYTYEEEELVDSSVVRVDKQLEW